MLELEKKLDPNSEIANLLATPYGEVDLLFSDFTRQPFDAELGGVIRPNISTRLPRSKNVQMSFSSKEQRRFAGLAITILNNLADGHVLGSTWAVPTLDERITEIYLNGVKEKDIQFLEANTEAIMSLIDDSSFFHPNLFSALHGMFEVAGADGTEIALKTSQRTLGDAYSNSLTEQNMGEYRSHLLPPHIFIGMHEDSTDFPIDPFEVHCTGKSFGKKIVEKTIIAALKINSSLPEINLSTLAITKGEIQNELLDHIRNLSKNLQIRI